MSHPAVAHLPAPFAWLLPELSAIDWPDETRADCSACPMLAEDRQVRFHPGIRCCTFHPTLPNFLLGRILRRGGPGGDRVRARIGQGEGVDRMGIAPSHEWISDYDARSTQDYGRSADLKCPYWVPGTLSCGIWEDRGAVCRTWFCRHVDGPSGHGLWHALRRSLRRIETALAQDCVAHLSAPPPTSVEAVVDWFVRCAERVDRLTPADLPSISGLEPLRGALQRAAGARYDPTPDVLVPMVESTEDTEDGVRLYGYSPYDDRVAPRWVFVLFEELDRQVPWRVARVHAEERVGEPISEEFVENLYRAGLLGPV